MEDMTEPEHIFGAMRECETGVRWKASVQRFEIDSLRWAATIRNGLRDDTFKTKGFMRFDIVERGKLRHIQSVHISERAVQKLLTQYALQPVIYPRLIYDNSASQVGKGTEFALKRLKEHLRWFIARYGKSGVIVIMDYHDYFGSIPHEGAIVSMAQKQTDPRICKHISVFVNAFDGDHGLGLGSETSQVGAICYPTPIDKLIKEKFRVHCYARYMDDSYMIFRTREEALACYAEVKTEAAKLGIAINDRKTKIHNLAADDFEYLKKRVHITETRKIIFRLTRQNIQDEQDRLIYLREEYEAGRMPLEAILQSYQSWRGYAQKYNAHEAVHNMDRFFVAVFDDVLTELCNELNKKHISFAHPPIGEIQKKKKEKEHESSGKS